MSDDVLVADSWLVDHGRVLTPAAHADRFAAGAATHGFSPQTAREALVDFARSVPRAGVWFPRIDLRVDHTLDTALRPAPERGGPVRLWTAPVDPRQTPRVKGPDLARLGALRATARLHGADEAVVVDAATGHVCEGAWSALVWWRGETLMVVDEGLPRVSSVTERWLVGRAVELGIEVAPVSAAPTDLAGAEVWTLSALHGVRPVVGWVDGPVVATPDLTRDGLIARWQADLVAARVEL